VIPVDAPESRQVKRIGFMAGQVEIPDDFDHMGEVEITAMFERDI